MLRDPVWKLLLEAPCGVVDAWLRSKVSLRQLTLRLPVQMVFSMAKGPSWKAQWILRPTQETLPASITYKSYDYTPRLFRCLPVAVDALVKVQLNSTPDCFRLFSNRLREFDLTTSKSQ